MSTPHVIRADAVYTPATARDALGLSKTTLGREIRLGRLRHTKRAGRSFIMGSWLLEWLADGEVRRKTKADAEV
jgi:hypothetical protein